VFSVIEELEHHLDRPVVTSNQAVVWDCVRRLGRPDRGPGRLFELGAAAEPVQAA
jgi:maleate isomerase